MCDVGWEGPQNICLVGGVQGQPHTNHSQPGPSVSPCPGRHLTPGSGRPSGGVAANCPARPVASGLPTAEDGACCFAPGGCAASHWGGPTAGLCPLPGLSLPTSQPGSAKSLLSRGLSAGEEGRKSVGGQGRGNCSGRKEVPTSQGCMCRCKGRWAGSKTPV